MYDKTLAQRHLAKLLKKHKINVHATSATSSGHAKIKSKSIKIPIPTNLDRFLVCLHEVHHIIKPRKGGKRFEKEFYCDMYARAEAIKLGFTDMKAWDLRTNWHILSRIAMAVNRGADPLSIKQEIKDWFHWVDFSEWKGKSVYIAYSKDNERGYIQTLQDTLPRIEIEKRLAENGMSLVRSNFDDSTWGNYLIKAEGKGVIGEFENLPAIVEHFKLTA